MKKVKTITIILAIIVVTMVAFAGVYMKTQNRMENKVKEYNFGREIDGGRIIEIKVATEESEKLTTENYKTVKRTIENRLNNLNAPDYTISLNEEDGTIRVELAEDDLIDTYAYFLTADNEVTIKEKDSDTVLLTDSMIKKAMYTYNANSEGAYQVYLELQLTKEGQDKIGEIQNNYAILANEVEEIEANQKDDNEAETEDMNNEVETESEEQENQEETKNIAKLYISETEYDVEKIEKDKISIKIGSESSNSTSVNNSLSSAAEISLLINSGKYPLKYEIEENKFVASDITEKQIIYFCIAIAIILFVIFIIAIIRYKGKGLLAGISYIGFISIFLLLLRYTNVIISIEGVGAIILTLIINIRVNHIILNKIKLMNVINEAFLNTYKDICLKLIPIMIIVLVFCFTGWTNINSFGMIMFWGLLLIFGYNALVTKTLLKLKESK